jgi:hypothetical protein
MRNLAIALAVISICVAFAFGQDHRKKELVVAKDKDSLLVEVDRDMQFVVRGLGKERIIYQEDFSWCGEVYCLCVDLDQDNVKETLIVPQDEGFYSIIIFKAVFTDGRPTGVKKLFQKPTIDNPDRKNAPFEKTIRQGQIALVFYTRSESEKDSSFVVWYDKHTEEYEIRK